MDFLKEWETKLAIKITCSQVCASKHRPLPQSPPCNLWKPVSCLTCMEMQMQMIQSGISWVGVSSGAAPPEGVGA